MRDGRLSSLDEEFERCQEHKILKIVVRPPNARALAPKLHKAECIRAYPLSDEEITALAHYLTHLERMLSESVQRSFEKIMRKP
jgi:hypothetical protein